MAPVLRRARLGDALALARVEVASWREAYPFILPPASLRRLTVDRCRARWVRRLVEDDGDDHWVFQLDQVVGYCTCGPTISDPDFAAEVFTLYLHPDHWCRGLGGQLFEHAVAALTRREFRWLYVWVLAENARARRFYRRRGLKADGARRRAHRHPDPSSKQSGLVLRYARPLNPLLPWSEPEPRAASTMD